MSIFDYKDITRVHALSSSYHFYIHGSVGPSEDYIDLLDTLYTATSSDIVYIHINSPGGYLDTACTILHAMAETEANVITCADGLVASAGSLIFFAGQAMKIGEFCEVMLHDGSSGELGKINENLKSAEFTSRRISNIYHKIYGRFLSKEEVDSVLDGKDLYLSGDEVEELIEKAIEEQGGEDDTTGS